ncbi:MAG: ATP-dependent RecD-like DNA helicase [Vallitalea sp.]|jgi:hypothetical protein|nr:ATP-dependent RecD-like DNA helicase [Vallitalea sp.]
MKLVLSEIYIADKNICRNIEICNDDVRGFISQNLLSQLRNLVEFVSILSYSQGQDVEVTYDIIKKSNESVKTRSKLNFLAKFHHFLQMIASHYIVGEESSERLMLKYYEYLIKVKGYLKSEFSIDILNNLYKFPIKVDSTLKIYYDKIAERIENPSYMSVRDEYTDRYYIRKIKPFFVQDKVYYEVTITAAIDNESKFGRIIAFTKQNISENYAVRLTLRDDRINLLNKNMPIHIIDQWEVSIRPCEINNFSKIIGTHINIQRSNVEYKGLMEYLTNSGMNFVEYIKCNDDYYNDIKSSILKQAKVNQFYKVLDKCRDLVNAELPGSNVICYLLYRMNNKIIKKQYHYNENKRLSNCYLKYGCIPFDSIPFSTSLIGHNPRFNDVVNAINISNHEDEVLARRIKSNTQHEAQLYTQGEELCQFGDLEKLIETYNNKLYYKHINRRIENFKGNYYIKGDEDNTKSIILILKDLSTNGMKNYRHFVDSWLTKYSINCEQKEKSIKTLFNDSSIALIYGAAGTGKSTMINHISNLFAIYKKLYLANTNPAIDNLKRNIKTVNCNFTTIASYTRSKSIDNECDILFIDECSTVSNDDMKEILEKTSFKLIVLVGDVFQIESIYFGNWFSIAKSFIPKTAVFELTKPYRSSNPDLLRLWNKVRNIDVDILEHITRNSYSIKLDETIFDSHSDDEIILCLNYDGLYGINNINQFLQINNKNKPVNWGILTYKVGDPILFNESDRFAPVIYNNLKGIIVGINKFQHRIQFDIGVDKVITDMDVVGQDFELVDSLENGNSVIRFTVEKYKSTDDDTDDSDTVVPFQVAYAVSIHKAQGLEYNSVKVVIADGVEELITHNIFYTAITRAKNSLKIYWTPETEKEVLENLKHRINKRDLSIFATKNNIKVIK